MKLSKIIRQLKKSTSRHKRRQLARNKQLAAEMLEDRTLLSNIELTMRGFEDTFGSALMDADLDGIPDTARSEVAKNVVRAATSHWGAIIRDFNYTLPDLFGDTYELEVRMKGTGAGTFNAETGTDTFGFDTFSGSPTGATVVLDRGGDYTGPTGGPDGKGDGFGYFLDPTPNDWAEFPNVVNAFVGNTNYAHPAFNTHDFNGDGIFDWLNFGGDADGDGFISATEGGLNDFYSLVAHEIGHAMGLSSHPFVDFHNNLASNTGNSDVDPSVGSPNGTLWTWRSTHASRAFLTSTNGSSDSAAPKPVHVAHPANSLTSNGDSFAGVTDLMNPFYARGQRKLISDLDSWILKDSFGYRISDPVIRGTFHAYLDSSTGTLTVNGGAGTSNDFISISRQSGGDLSVFVSMDNVVPGTLEWMNRTDGRASYTSVFSIFETISIQSIVINSGSGDDRISFSDHLPGNALSIVSGAGADTVNLVDVPAGSVVTIDTGSGEDLVTVSKVAESADVTIRTDDDADTIVFGSTESPFSIPNLDILGDVHIEASASSSSDTNNRIEFDESIGIQFDGSSGIIDLKSGGRIDFVPEEINELEIEARPGDHDFVLQSLAPGMLFRLFARESGMNRLIIPDLDNVRQGDVQFIGSFHHDDSVVLTDTRTGDNLFYNIQESDVVGDGGLLGRSGTELHFAPDFTQPPTATLQFVGVGRHTLNTASGDSTILYFSADANNQWTINGSAGDQHLWIAPPYSEDELGIVGRFGGDLDDVAVRTTFNGGGGLDTIRLSDANSRLTNKVQFDAAEILYNLDRGPTGQITYNDVDSIVFFAGDASDTFDVLSNTAGTTLEINGEGGNDQFNIGDGDYIANIQGEVTVFGGSDTDSITFDDSSAQAFDSQFYAFETETVDELMGTFTKTGVINIGFPLFQPSPTLRFLVEDVQLDALDADASFYVTGTTTDTLALNGNGANDEFFIGDGTLETIHGLVSVQRLSGLEPGTVDLTIDDQDDTGFHVYDINFGEVVKHQSSGNATIQFDVLAVDQLTLNANRDRNFIDVHSNFTLNTNINSGGGNDVIRVTPDTENLSLIFGQLSFDGQDGTDVLQIFDDGGDANYTIYSTLITSDFPSGNERWSLDIGQVDIVHLFATNGDNTVDINFTDDEVHYQVLGRDGVDIFNVGSGDLTPTIRGSVRVDGGSGPNSLNIDDSDDEASMVTYRELRPDGSLESVNYYDQDIYSFGETSFQKTTHSFRDPRTNPDDQWILFQPTFTNSTGTLTFDSIQDVTLEASGGVAGQEFGTHPSSIFEIDGVAHNVQLTVNGNDGPDSFRIDALGQQSDVRVNGGLPNSSPGDSLHVNGVGFLLNARYTPDLTNPKAGVISTQSVFSPGSDRSSISFTGLEPVTVEDFASVTLVTPRSHDNIDVEDVGDGWTRISGTSGSQLLSLPFETLTFRGVREVTLDAASRDWVPFQFPPGPSGITYPPFPFDTINIQADALNATGLEVFNVLTGPGFNRVNDHTLESSSPVTGRLETNGTGGTTHRYLYGSAGILEIEQLPNFGTNSMARDAAGQILTASSDLFVELLVIPRPADVLRSIMTDGDRIFDATSGQQFISGSGLTTVQAAVDPENTTLDIVSRGKRSVVTLRETAIRQVNFFNDRPVPDRTTIRGDSWIFVGPQPEPPSNPDPARILGTTTSDVVILEGGSLNGTLVSADFYVDARHIYDGVNPHIAVDLLVTTEPWRFLINPRETEIPKLHLVGNTNVSGTNNGHLSLPAIGVPREIDPLGIELLVRNLERFSVDGEVESLQLEQLPGDDGSMSLLQPNSQFMTDVGWNNVELLVVPDPPNVDLVSRDTNLLIDAVNGLQRFSADGRTTIDVGVDEASRAIGLDVGGNSSVSWVGMLLPALARDLFNLRGDPSQADTLTFNVDVIDLVSIPELPPPWATFSGWTQEDRINYNGLSVDGQEEGISYTADATRFFVDDGRKVELLLRTAGVQDPRQVVLSVEIAGNHGPEIVFTGHESRQAFNSATVMLPAILFPRIAGDDDLFLNFFTSNIADANLIGSDVDDMVTLIPQPDGGSVSIVRPIERENPDAIIEVMLFGDEDLTDLGFDGVDGVDEVDLLNSPLDRNVSFDLLGTEGLIVQPNPDVVGTLPGVMLNTTPTLGTVSSGNLTLHHDDAVSQFMVENSSVFQSVSGTWDREVSFTHNLTGSHSTFDVSGTFNAESWFIQNGASDSPQNVLESFYSNADFNAPSNQISMGGSGADIVRQSYQNVDYVGSWEIATFGGPDTIIVDHTNVTISGPTVGTHISGDGNDTVLATFDVAHVDADHIMTFDLGTGTDVLGIVGTDVHLNNSNTVSILGSEENTILMSEAAATPVPELLNKITETEVATEAELLKQAIIDHGLHKEKAADLDPKPTVGGPLTKDAVTIRTTPNSKDKIVLRVKDTQPVATKQVSLRINGGKDFVSLRGPQELDALAGTEIVVDGPVQIHTVTNTSDSGPGSLRAAMEAANGATEDGLAVITFAIPATDPGYVDVDSHLTAGDADPDVIVLTPHTALPALVRGNTVINGQSQQNASGDTNPFGPEVVLDGSQIRVITDNPNNVPTFNGLHLASSNNHVHGLTIQHFSGNGILIENDSVLPTNGLVNKNTFLAATTASSVAEYETIGLAPANTYTTTDGRVSITAHGLYVGALPNTGVENDDWTLRLPGPDIAAGLENFTFDLAQPAYSFGFDFVESHFDPNVNVGSPADSTFQVVLKNGPTEVGSFTFNAPDDAVSFVGAASPIAFDRVEMSEIVGSHDNEFLGKIYIGDSPATAGRNTVTGNYIGTSADGITAVSNGESGIRIENSSGNLIGGTTQTGRNVISGNNGSGIAVIGGSTNSPNSVEFDDKQDFLATTGAVDATGPIPNLGASTGEIRVGQLTFSPAPGGLLHVGGSPLFDYYPPRPGSEIAISGVENLNIDLDSPAQSIGFEFIEPNLTMPSWGGSPVDSEFTATMLLNGTVVDSFTFSRPDDLVSFVGFSSHSEFARVEIRETIGSRDDEYFGRFYVGSGSPENMIQGNFIGTTADGERALANGGDGVHIVNSGGNLIGGTTDTARNVISGNQGSGIVIEGGSQLPSLVGSWQGNGNTNDSTGTNDGEFFGATFTDGARGGQAFLFDGNDDYVQIPNSPEFEVETVTVSAWVRSTEPASVVDYFVTKGGHIQVAASYALYQINGNVRFYIFNGTSAIRSPGISAGAIYDGEWHHLAGTFDGNSVRLYVDGEEVGEGTATTDSIKYDLPSSNDLFIGNYIDAFNGGTFNFAGAIDEVSLFDEALAAEQVARLHATGSPIVGQNSMQGNYIGTTADGMAALGNAGGINIINSSNNIIGGPSAAARNIVSASTAGYGIAIAGAGAINNLIAGNYIGTDVTGTLDRGNASSGLLLQDTKGNTLRGNVISGNTANGVYVVGSTPSTDVTNLIESNRIGTDATGTQDLGNTLMGVRVLRGTGLRVHGNVISGNDNTNVFVDPLGRDVVIEDNLVGTDHTGNSALHNAGPSGGGITLAGRDNIVRRNVISANPRDGVNFDGMLALDGRGSNNLLQNNLIGVGLDGETDVGNGRDGIRIWRAAQNNMIGSDEGDSDDRSDGNVIAHNAGAGVRVFDANSTGNRIRGNSIHSNGELGIDIGAGGVTLNDPGDGDWGANNLQNFPGLLAVRSGSTTRVVGQLASEPNQSFTLDFYASTEFDPSYFGEGERWLDAFTVTTDGAGVATFDVELNGATVGGDLISGTATATDGSTSEFSAVFMATGDFIIGGGWQGDMIQVDPGSVIVSVNGIELGHFDWDEHPEKPIEVFGLAGDDTIEFNVSQDAIVSGGDGNDEIQTSVGNDSVDGGKGNDVIRTGDGDDQIDGGDGDDEIDGQGGSDSVAPGNGMDTIETDADDDLGDFGFEILAPASLTTESVAVRGQKLTMQTQFPDPNSTVAWNFGDDGAATGSQASHVYADAGTYHAMVTISDSQGNHTSIGRDLPITVTALQVDPQDESKTALAIGGSTGSDRMLVTRQGNSDEVKVLLDGSSLGVFSPSGHLLMYGQAGDDDLGVSSAVSLPAWMFGDAGNDHLKGGGGDNVLDGGDGDDRLIGGSGRELLVGGAGRDRLVGNAGDDILIGGLLAFENYDAALAAIMAEWSSDRSFTERTANLRGDDQNPSFDQRCNGSTFLKVTGVAATVRDDGEHDVLTGASGRNWFFANLDDDHLTDLQPEDILSEIEEE